MEKNEEWTGGGISTKIIKEQRAERERREKFRFLQEWDEE